MMEPESYRVMYEMEDTHWWLASRREIVLDHGDEAFVRMQVMRSVPIDLLETQRGGGHEENQKEDAGSVSGHVSRVACGP